jgi:hypothetical protein
MSTLTIRDPRSLHEEALLMLDGEGAILEIAREISRLLQEQAVPGAIVGGVAVWLYGYARTTDDVDVLVGQSGQQVFDLLSGNDFEWDSERREFRKAGVPVHLVTSQLAGQEPTGPVERAGILTLDLARIVEMKLRSGSTNLLRAQDLADVIGLIRANQLTSAFASRLERSVRADFRKLARAIAAERPPDSTSSASHG